MIYKLINLNIMYKLINLNIMYKLYLKIKTIFKYN